MVFLRKKRVTKNLAVFCFFTCTRNPKWAIQKIFLLAFSPLKSAELWTNSALFCLHTAEAYVASFTSAAKGFERGRRELPNEKLMDWISPLFFAVKYRRKAKKMACSGEEKGGRRKRELKECRGRKEWEEAEKEDRLDDVAALAFFPPIPPSLHPFVTGTIHFQRPFSGRRRRRHRRGGKALALSPLKRKS